MTGPHQPHTANLDIPTVPEPPRATSDRDETRYVLFRVLPVRVSDSARAAA
jgi:hypothetical protein